METIKVFVYLGFSCSCDILLCHRYLEAIFWSSHIVRSGACKFPKTLYLFPFSIAFILITHHLIFYIFLFNAFCCVTLKYNMYRVLLYVEISYCSLIVALCTHYVVYIISLNSQCNCFYYNHKISSNIDVSYRYKLLSVHLTRVE